LARDAHRLARAWFKGAVEWHTVSPRSGGGRPDVRLTGERAARTPPKRSLESAASCDDEADRLLNEPLCNGCRRFAVWRRRGREALTEFAVVPSRLQAAPLRDGVPCSVARWARSYWHGNEHATPCTHRRGDRSRRRVRRTRDLLLGRT